MSNDKPRFWANGNNANIKEPHSALMESGWRYGDIPTASNFNWLFNQIQKDLHAAKAEMKELKEQKEKLESDIKSMHEEIGTFKNSIAKVKKTADHSLDEVHLIRKHTSRNIEHLREISISLNDFVMELRQFNPSLRERSWELKDEFDLLNEHG